MDIVDRLAQFAQVAVILDYIISRAEPLFAVSLTCDYLLNFRGARTVASHESLSLDSGACIDNENTIHKFGKARFDQQRDDEDLVRPLRGGY